MRRPLTTLLVVITFLALAFGQGDQKKRIAVLDFDFASIQPWWGGYWDIGAGVADILVKDLVRDGTFRVIERSALDAVLAEQDFSNSDRANPSTAASIGRVLGVDAIVVGSITQFGTETKKKSIGGLGGGWGGFGGARVGTSEGKASVVVDARIVDVETGEILAVADGKGESSRSGLLLGGGGGGGGSFGGGQIDMSSSDFQETILGEATHEAVDQLASELSSSRARIPARAREINGLVAFAEGGLVILNVGRAQGVQVGMELKIERVRRTIKDPATGKVLREMTEMVGLVRVTQVEEASAEAELLSGTDIKVGDRVRQ